MQRTDAVRSTRITWFVTAAAICCLLFWTATNVQAQGRGPCAEDAAKYCKDIEPGGGRIALCLKEHENDLSGACKKHIAQMKERGKGIHEACQDDALKLCKDVQPGGGGIYRCLKEHESELSSACKEKLPKGKKGK